MSDASDEVTALRVIDGEREVRLPRKARFALGAAPPCEVTLSWHGRAPERRRARLRLHDQRSAGGAFIGARRIGAAELFPGDTLWLAPVTLLAMSEELRAARRVMVDILGHGGEPTPDRLLVSAVKAAHHFLLTGEPGSDLERLARVLHAVSPHRDRPFIEVAELPADRDRQRELMTHTAGSTLLLHLARPPGAAFCAMLFSPRYDVRVIALAPTSATVGRMFGDEPRTWVQRVSVRPLSERRDDVLDLLDRALVERGAPVRVADLVPRNRAALVSHAWRRNLAELRLAADRLAAIARVPEWDRLDWRERATAIGVAKSSLHDWFLTLRLAVPLFVRP